MEIKVSIFEYDKEKEEKKLRKAEYEHGLEDGRQESLAELITKMYKNGFTVEQISTAIDKSVEEIKEILNRDAI